MKKMSFYLIAIFLSVINFPVFATPTVTVTGTPPPATNWTTIQSYNNNPGNQSQQYYSNMNAMYTQKAMEEAKRADEEKEKKRKRAILDCKVGLEVSLKETKDALYRDYRSNTSTCNNYHILATTSGIIGAVASVPTFGFTAAAGMSGAVSFATAGVMCQQNADGAYAQLVAHNEYITRQFDLTVCDQIK